METKHQPGRPPNSPDGSATSHIHIRTTKNRKRAYSTAAQGGGLTEWIFNQCDPSAAKTIDARIAETELVLLNETPGSRAYERAEKELAKLQEFRRALDRAEEAVKVGRR